MPSPLSMLKQAALLSAALLALSSASFASGLSASAAYTDVQTSLGVYDYTLTLNNTGSTAIGTFWFAWVPGDGFLNPPILSVQSPTGWNDKITSSGTAIQWTTTSSLLASGSSLSGFGFSSNETPAELALTTIPNGGTSAVPVTTSFVYIGAPFGDPGYEFAATPMAPAPELPSGLLTLGGLGLAAVFSRCKQIGIQLRP